MDWLPSSLDDWGTATLAALLLAGYLVVGEPVAGYVLHRRFEGRLSRDRAARRSFYRRLLILEWGLTVLAVVSALAGGPPALVLVLLGAAAFGLAHAYQGVAGIVTTGILGGVLAALYLDTGSLLLPVLLHAAIDLRFLLVPASVLPALTRTAP